LAFGVTFRICAGLQTEICEGADNFGEEFFFFDDGVRLILKVFAFKENWEFFPGDLEHKNCELDLTLTGI
jgi:hypothetical protein